jgi:hypothetical protein
VEAQHPPHLSMITEKNEAEEMVRQGLNEKRFFRTY